MNARYAFKIAFTGLKTNGSRSILTVLGIVIGVTAIIVIMSIGSGAEKLILDQIGGFGAEMVVIRPGREPTGPSDIAQTLFADSLKTKDIEALKKKSNVPDLAQIAPAVIVPGSVSYKGETYRPQIFGWTAEFMGGMLDVFPSEGVLFGEAEVRQRASVALIGFKVKEELFGELDALGENIKIKDRNFKVIGVYPKTGQRSFINIDDLILVPYSTAQTYLLGIDYFHEVMIKATSPEAVARTVHDIEITLRETHGITDPEKDDFFVVTQEGTIEQVQSIIGILTAFLSSVVAIALVVGGIGVMNIMLVSVTERTKEIGLRKAVGATNRDILTQFLMESVVLTVVGGIIGILLGALISFMVSVLLTQFLDLSWTFSFPVTGAVLGIAVSAITGLVFGLYPARQASKKSPIEALIYE